MPILINDKANERSTYVLTITFKDEDNDVVIPNASSIKWTLTDSEGNIVNGRDQVSIVSASTIRIILTGLDLAIGGDLLDTERKLLIEATYDSSLGMNLPLTEEITFSINNFVKLSGVS